jgi:UDP-N-acetylmuramoyl-L-alanyl-D-glutamate--2,6-diaminopimelate ligase
MLLTDLIGPDTPIDNRPETAVDVVALTADSRQVGPGALFAALPGSVVDGRRFIADAAAAGAVAILTTRDGGIPRVDIPILRSSDPRRALALMAARFYDRQPATTVAVTGTSGKTSVADFTRQIFARLGHRAASVGTIGVVTPDGASYGSLTTPDPVTLAARLAELADQGITHLAFEASSHGLDQRRLDGIRIAAAAYTNLGRDHLDYHPTVTDYLAAKLRLFDTLLPPTGTAVVNIDDDHAADVIAAASKRGARVITVGQADTADIHLRHEAADGYRQRLAITYAGHDNPVALNLIGAYQASNAALAAGLAIATGEAPDAVFAAFAELRGVPGRLEVVGEVDHVPIVVDYAHKPDALDAALKALRPFVNGRLICVFGCGGDRDKGKRPIMGRIASELADLTIVTDDNPRSEEPAGIRAEILAGHPHAVEIGDRAEAISAAISGCRPGDVVVIAGKGHETGQIVGDTTLPFSDRDVIRAILSNAQ